MVMKNIKWIKENYCHHHDSKFSLKPVMPKGKKVNLFLTDHPYNIGIKYSEEVNDKLPDEEYQNLLRKTLINCYDVADDSAHFFIIHYPHLIAKHWSNVIDSKQVKWKFHQWKIQSVYWSRR